TQISPSFIPRFQCLLCSNPLFRVALLLHASAAATTSPGMSDKKLSSSRVYFLLRLFLTGFHFTYSVICTYVIGLGWSFHSSFSQKRIGALAELFDASCLYGTVYPGSAEIFVNYPPDCKLTGGSF
ncbi:hypothetical protein BT96DRAFT_919951, partial [Gymnopus androsaceus JB14]